MSTPEDQVDTESAQSPLSALQAPPTSPEGRAWGTNYLKAHPEGVDTKGEAALLQDFAANAEDARAALRQARERLAAQRMDPSVLGLRFAQAMLSPSRYGIPDQWGKAAGTVADWRQQNQEFQQQQGNQDLSLAQQLTGVDRQSLQARLALQELKERTQSTMLDAAMKATAQPPRAGAESAVGKLVTDRLGPSALQTPEGQALFDKLAARKEDGTPHYSLVEHDVVGPDGTPAKQTYMLETSSGKVTPFGAPAPTTKGAGLDARSGALFQRVLSSANEATSAIDNITNLPTGASSGWFGVGSSPGQSLFSSAKGVLTNKLAPQEVQSYMSMLPGLAKNLAMVESGGLQTAQSLNDVFSKLELREGDTGYTRLHKLAEYRQIVEKGIEPYLHNPRIPPEQKEEIQQMVNDLRASVPFVHNDVTGLERAHEKTPDMTLQQYIQSQGLGNTAPVEVKSPDEAKALPSGTRFKTPDGRVMVKR